MISVIIATRDRAQLLRETLQALLSQDDPGRGFEVVVVDNGSVDETPAVVDEAARRATMPVIYAREPTAGKSHALNTAVRVARGDLLVFTDDDVLPSRGWLAAFARVLDETGSDFATGRILPRWEATPPTWMSPQLYGALSVADAGLSRLPLAKGLNNHIMPMGGNLAMRRHVVERIGGWNPDLGSLQGTLRTGEDHEFALKMFDEGFQGVYEPEATVAHRVPAERMRLGYLLRWLIGNGAVHAAIEQRFPTTPRYLLKVPRYRWREFALDLLDVGHGAITLDRPRLTAAAMRVTWFGAYVVRRWQLPLGPVNLPQHAAKSPS